MTAPSRGARPRTLPLALLGALALAACDDGPSGPREGYVVRVQSGDGQLGGFGAFLENPLRVLVEDANTGDPAVGIAVSWSVVTGAGATLLPASSTTSANGIASTTLRLGPSDTLYRVTATVDQRVGEPATFEARAVPPARIDSITPAQVDAGDTITIHGSAFATAPGSNTVLVAGLRAEVLEAAAGMLRAIVPPCTPTRSADVRVLLGSVASNVVSIEVTGDAVAPASMAVGDVLLLPDAMAASCLRLPADAGARYLLVLQNGAPVAGRDLAYRLAGAAAQTSLASAGLQAARGERGPSLGAGALRSRAAAARRQAALDAGLRDLERLVLAARPPRLAEAAQRVAAPPVQVGDRREFWVFRAPGDYARVTAEVRHVSDHAILYQDLDAPAGGFTSTEFQAFGEVFDDPIFESMAGVYGEPSDIDGNGRVIILFTPVVNQMTPPNSPNSFVAGFFFGIDLLPDQARGNEAEIFYTLVPDPDAQFGNVRTFQQMLEGVPPVMAHEFQHMIHFNQRVLVLDAGLDVTWLSEGLAHTAEELIGDVYLSRGDDERAFDFKIQNFLRAGLYLEGPDTVSPLGPATPLPVRGAAWLLLEYLQGHFGGNALLAGLTQTTRNGVANITGEVGLPWTTILSRWGTANYADGAGIPGIDAIYGYPTLDLRQVYQPVGFPLQPEEVPFADFTRTGTLAASSAAYWLLDAGASPAQLHVAVAGRNAPFGADDRPQLTVLRIQ